MPNGVDVSRYNSAIPPGYDFVIIQVCWGTDEDPMWKTHRDQARALGMVIGYYAGIDRTSGPGDQQAEKFLELLGADVPELGYWSDCEHNSAYPANTPTPDQCAAHAGRLRATGRNGVYANAGDYANLCAPWADALPLWFAAYGPNDGSEHPPNPPAPRGYVIHQYTSNPIDKNAAATLAIWPPAPDDDDETMNYYTTGDGKNYTRELGFGMVFALNATNPDGTPAKFTQTLITPQDFDELDRTAKAMLPGRTLAATTKGPTNRRQTDGTLTP